MPWMPSPQQIALAEQRLSGDPCASAPDWCSWVPFSDFMSACHPIDPRACQQSQFGPAMTQASRDAALRAGDAAEADYWATNPEAAQDYAFWLRNQDIYRLDPGAVRQEAEDTMTKMFLGAALVLGVLIFVKN